MKFVNPTNTMALCFIGTHREVDTYRIFLREVLPSLTLTDVPCQPGHAGLAIRVPVTAFAHGLTELALALGADLPTDKPKAAPAERA